jgi:hypothetical protein
MFFLKRCIIINIFIIFFIYGNIISCKTQSKNFQNIIVGGSIKLSSSIEEIIDKLGKPKENKIFPNEASGGNTTILIYDGLEIIFNEFPELDKNNKVVKVITSITKITITSNKYLINNDIKVGYNKDTLLKLYNETRMIENNYISYEISGDTYIGFYLNNNVIEKIIIFIDWV